MYNILSSYLDFFQALQISFCFTQRLEELSVFNRVAQKYNYIFINVISLQKLRFCYQMNMCFLKLFIISYCMSFVLVSRIFMSVCSML